MSTLPKTDPVHTARGSAQFIGGQSATAERDAFGNRSDLLMTHDGGIQWTDTTVSDGTGGPAQVVFFNPSDGVAIAYVLDSLSIAIWHTSDGGGCWTSTTPQLDWARHTGRLTPYLSLPKVVGSSEAGCQIN